MGLTFDVLKTTRCIPERRLYRLETGVDDAAQQEEGRILYGLGPMINEWPDPVKA